jgi:hypothetical protein
MVAAAGVARSNAHSRALREAADDLQDGTHSNRPSPRLGLKQTAQPGGIGRLIEQATRAWCATSRTPD